MEEVLEAAFSVRSMPEKTKVLTQNKYMAMGPSGARCQE
jgi:hypothetical protein